MKRNKKNTKFVIDRILELKSWTAVELATHLGLTQTAVCLWRKGSNLPNIKNFNKLKRMANMKIPDNAPTEKEFAKMVRTADYIKSLSKTHREIIDALIKD